MKRRILFLATIALATTLLASIPSEAQPGGGTLGGSIHDETGKTVAGATIRVEGTTQGAISKADGSFIVAAIRPGEYGIKVTSVGYAPFTATIRISEGETTTLNVKLTVKSLQGKEVAVMVRRAVLPERNGTVRSRTMNESTSSSSASALDNSARTNIQGAVALSSGVTSGGVNGFSIRGGRVTETSIRVDGIEISDPFMGAFETPEGEKPAPEEADDEQSEAAPPEEPIVENEFVATMHEPTSTFGIDVDKASYSLMRQLLNQGQLPSPGSVRIEEMINYFHYDYPEPTGSDPFSVITEVAECPWNKDHKLVHIGLQGRHVDMSAVPPSNLVFLIDVSGSMGSYEKLPLLVEGFKLMVNELRPEDRVAIVVYAGAAGVVLPSTPGSKKSAIIAALEELAAGGSTAGGAGIELAYKIAADHFLRDGNNRVILATDGDFNVGVSSSEALVKLIEKKRQAGIFLTVLGFGMGYGGDTRMEQLADNGNGSYAYIDDINEARRVLVNELSGTLLTIAKDVKLQIEFNPIMVAGYRLIGYENRVLANEDFANDRKDAGDLGAGHTVTALYEIIPSRYSRDEKPQLSDASSPSMRYQIRRLNPEAITSNELMDIRLRYKAPNDSVSKLIERPLADRVAEIGTMSENFRFAAAVAEFGLLLRDSKYKGTASFDDLLTLANGALGADPDGARQEFVGLAEKCKTLKNAGAKGR